VRPYERLLLRAPHTRSRPFKGSLTASLSLESPNPSSSHQTPRRHPERPRTSRNSQLTTPGVARRRDAPCPLCPLHTHTLKPLRGVPSVRTRLQRLRLSFFLVAFAALLTSTAYLFSPTDRPPAPRPFACSQQSHSASLVLDPGRLDAAGSSPRVWATVQR